VVVVAGGGDLGEMMSGVAAAVHLSRGFKKWFFGRASSNNVDIYLQSI